MQVLIDGVEGSPAAVAVALMRAVAVVIGEPVMEVQLQTFDGFIEGGAEDFAKELVEDGAVEAFHEAVGLWPAHAGGAVFDVSQCPCCWACSGIRSCAGWAAAA